MSVIKSAASKILMVLFRSIPTTTDQIAAMTSTLYLESVCTSSSSHISIPAPMNEPASVDAGFMVSGSLNDSE